MVLGPFDFDFQMGHFLRILLILGPRRRGRAGGSCSWRRRRAGCRRSGGLRRGFWRTGHSGLLSGSALPIPLLYIQSFVRDHFWGFFGIFLLGTRFPGGFRNRLRILRLGKGSGREQEYAQNSPTRE